MELIILQKKNKTKRIEKNNNLKEWRKLDNAAKIFPPATDKKDPKVFRFSCELFEIVEKEILQQALEKTMKIFSNFNVVMKRGMFWYYLEESNVIPKVKEEYKHPCSAIYDENKKGLLFEVTYYKKRINLEIYHVLSDGTGALNFLIFLISNYFVIKRPEEYSNILKEIKYDASKYEKEDDSFQKYYDKNIKKVEKLRYVYQLSGNKMKEGIKIIEGTMSLKKIQEKAHEYNTTITGLITAIMIKAIYKEMKVKDRKRQIVVEIPVNLRKRFDSVSARNFFATVSIKYMPNAKDNDLTNIINTVNSEMKKELALERLKERINTFLAVEHNFIIRPIPLFIKNVVLKISTKIVSYGRSTSLSNIGNIDMPLELKNKINKFSMMVSTKTLQGCLCSYNDNMVLTFSSMFENTDIQKKIYREIVNMEVDVAISTNKNE